MDQKSTKSRIQMLHLSEAIDQLARTNSVRWFGHVLMRDKINCLRRALDLNVNGAWKWVDQENLSKSSHRAEQKSCAERM